MFSVLAESDSDDEVAVAFAPLGALPPLVAFAPGAIVALAPDQKPPEDLPNVPAPPAEEEEPLSLEGQRPLGEKDQDDEKPTFRTWSHQEEENRFKTEDMKKNIFSSPFSKGRKGLKQWSRPRFKENEEGWMSIRWNQPQFQEEEEFEKVAVEYEPRTEEDFPALIESAALESRKVMVVEDSPASWNKEEEALTAVVWAERIKRSLEKAELSRSIKAKETRTIDQPDFKESLGRLSFFRRPVADIPEIVLTE
jgi:hypothetical protein